MDYLLLSFLISFGLIFAWWTLSKYELKNYLAGFLAVSLLALLIFAYKFNNAYYLLSFFIFVPILAYIFNWLIKRDDVPIIETRFRGDGYNISDGARIISVNKEVIDRCTHIGDNRRNFWELSNIFYTDLYDEEKNIMYHSEYAELKNQTFFSAKMVYLAIKNKVPALIEECAVMKAQFEIYSHQIARKMFEDSLLSYPMAKKYTKIISQDITEMKERIKELENQVLGEVSGLDAIQQELDSEGAGSNDQESES